jgi:hypothetical protein
MTVSNYCDIHGIKFTRSRPYRKNDQAWIEQKNGAVVRRLVGYERFSGIVACQALSHLFQISRLYVNFFQPSFKLKERVRIGAKVRRKYHEPKTPCDRLLMYGNLEDKFREYLLDTRQKLDPIILLQQLREAQAALAALSNQPNETNGPVNLNLEVFLARLPKLWKSGEVRPTHRTPPAKERTWRTRKDPFEKVWMDVLQWLQEQPDVTAKELLDRLRNRYPGQFNDGKLRTLQRRVREWRKIMARKLIGMSLEEIESFVEF